MVIKEKIRTFKKQWRQVKRSVYPVSDFSQLIYAYLFRPTNFFISSRVRFINRGSYTSNGPFYFGIICNKINAAASNGGLFKIGKNGAFKCGKNVRISEGCEVHVNGSLTIGNNTYIMPNTLIVINSALAIGDDCAISWNCQIMDNDGHDFFIDGRKKESIAPIVIGNKVWIGSRCTIKKGVTIGNGSVIASGSVVTRDVPERTVVAGMPAKVVRENIEWQ